jgi:Flp pilus assembly protein TadG
MATAKKRLGGNGGHAMVEAALMCPWILLLFMGLFDMGFYTYAAIATQNAANAAALYVSADWERPTSGAIQSATCTNVLQEMNSLPNMTGVSTCNALPLIVAVTTNPAPCVSGQACDAVVSVTYRTIQLFPIPGLMGRMTLTRTTRMRVMES